MTDKLFVPDSLSLGLGLNVTSFYGVVKGGGEDRIECKTKVPSGLPYRLSNLLGPTQVWRVFKKQVEALAFAKKTRNGVMTFAFQQSDGARLFLVAHPKVFWHYDTQKGISQRCAYEVIPESTACKLYFDLEFETEYNSDKKGPLIVDILITVILYFLSSVLKIEVRKENVLNLDSSTDKKFSCHLIIQLGYHAFSDNKSAGAFVSFICQKLNLYFDGIDQKGCSSGVETEPNNFTEICTCCKGDKHVGCIRNIGLTPDVLKELVVFDRKGSKHLICDLSVYSRNRHFRLFQSTKWGKNSPLVISKDNCYSPSVMRKEIKSGGPDDINNEAIFLDSLITYFRTTEVNFHEVGLQVIDFKNPFQLAFNDDASVSASTNKEDLSMPSPASHLNVEKVIPTSDSPYPQVDKFVNSIVFPGHIWRSTFFNSTSVIVYDIVGNRYCHNIRRQHHSNNVKYVVNLNNYQYYQKCHDPECSSFRSEANMLPPELKFQLEDEVFISDDIEAVLKKVECSDNYISDSDLLEIANVVEDLSALASDGEF